ncbi:hypothetical protein, partial [Bosea sp. (in: a-proteobacteria)]|uniref:hypothetical protein n=1 Tax=Bosea sp. (in: a-proteobacteria) TaxID=1871050 RepID=UPI0031FE46EC
LGLIVLEKNLENVGSDQKDAPKQTNMTRGAKQGAFFKQSCVCLVLPLVNCCACLNDDGVPHQKNMKRGRFPTPRAWSWSEGYGRFRK